MNFRFGTSKALLDLHLTAGLIRVSMVEWQYWKLGFRMKMGSSFSVLIPDYSQWRIVQADPSEVRVVTMEGITRPRGAGAFLA